MPASEAAAALPDQRAHFDALRERCPLALGDVPQWTVLRHADVLRVLHDHERFGNAVSNHPAVPNGYDPPLHTAYRRALDGFFAPERMQRFEPECRDIAASLVQQALGLRSSWAAKPWRRASACRSTGSPPTAIRALSMRPMTSASTATRC